MSNDALKKKVGDQSVPFEDRVIAAFTLAEEDSHDGMVGVREVCQILADAGNAAFSPMDVRRVLVEYLGPPNA